MSRGDVAHKGSAPVAPTPQVLDKALLRDSDNYEAMIKAVSQVKEKVEELRAEGLRYNEHQKMFGLQPARFADLEESVDGINLRLDLWEMLQATTQLTPQWNATSFYAMNMDAMTAIVTRWFKTAQRCERDLPPNEVSTKLKNVADTYRQTLPIVTDMLNPKIQPRHWEKVEETLGQKVVRDEKLTLGTLLDLRIVQHRDPIQQISTEATQESALEALLSKVPTASDVHAPTHACAHTRARTHRFSRHGSRRTLWSSRTRTRAICSSSAPSTMSSRLAPATPAPMPPCPMARLHTAAAANASVSPAWPGALCPHSRHSCSTPMCTARIRAIREG